MWRSVLVGVMLVAACAGDPVPRDAPPNADAPPAVFEGDLIIRSQADAAQLANVGVIMGSLVVDGDGIYAEARALLAVRDHVTVTRGVLVAPMLTDVGATLTICRDDVRALTTVGGDIVVECPPLGVSIASVYLTALARVDGGLLIKRLPQGGITLPLVPRLSFLRAVQTEIPWIEHGPIAIREVYLPGLTTIDMDLDFTFTTLQFLELPALQSVASIKFYANEMLCNSVAVELASRTGAPSEIMGNASCVQ